MMRCALVALGFVALQACTGGTTTTPPVETDADADSDADTDTDTDSDADTDVADTGILEKRWEGSFTETFVGEHTLVAHYNKTDTDLCRYTWKTVGVTKLSSCTECGDLQWEVAHSDGAPWPVDGGCEILQLASFGVSLPNRTLGYASSFEYPTGTIHSSVMVEYFEPSGNYAGGWYPLATAEYAGQGSLLTYSMTEAYYFY